LEIRQVRLFDLDVAAEAASLERFPGRRVINCAYEFVKSLNARAAGVRPMLGFHRSQTAAITISSIEGAEKIRKPQFKTGNLIDVRRSARIIV
jgi:hypothetical protein